MELRRITCYYLTGQNDFLIGVLNWNKEESKMIIIKFAYLFHTFRDEFVSFLKKFVWNIQNVVVFTN